MSTAVCALLGAGLLGAIGLRTLRGTAETLAIALAGILGVSASAVATFDHDSLASPRFSGVLDRAPYVVGQTQGLVKRLESYRSGLADFVDSVTALYAVVRDCPRACKVQPPATSSPCCTFRTSTTTPSASTSRRGWPNSSMSTPSSTRAT